MHSLKIGCTLCKISKEWGAFFVSNHLKHFSQFKNPCDDEGIELNTYWVGELRVGIYSKYQFILQIFVIPILHK